MLLRNYDNYKAIVDMARSGISGRIVYVNYNHESDFSDGHLCLKNTSGTTTSNFSGSLDKRDALPFVFYSSSNAITSSGSNLICGYIGEDVVGYDDYIIDNMNASLIFVSHNTTNAKVNENNEVESVYTKIMCNSSNEDITINCIGATMGICGYVFLLYKEKIPEITIPAGGNVVLTFTTKASLGQNKPADYVATASVE